jgi:hypothetical protein
VGFWAAAFFAVYEGHQEAVMWYAAANELLLFLFGFLCLINWLTWLDRGQWHWFGLCAVSFIFALLSKESSVVLIPLLLLVAMFGRFKWGRVLMVVPFIIVAAVYSLMIFQTRDSSFRFHDQSFVLTAPFWETWTKSYFGLLLPWGWLAIAILARQRKQTILTLSVVWIAIAFVPYMFVDYVHSIPSRQTYLASFGLALLVGAAIVHTIEIPAKAHQLALGLTLIVLLAHNVVYLRFVKHKQFLVRAQPTEELISFSRSVAGPIYVRCFPRPPIIGDAAVEVMTGKPHGTLIWTEAEATARGTTQTFCYQQ